MAENIQFLVARCRNAQKREGPGFLLDLGRRTGLSPDELTLVDPAQAIPLRREIDRHVEEGVKAGTVHRRSGLTVAQATEALDELRASQPDQPVYAFLLHSEHFPFSVPLRSLLGAWRAVLDLDGDTVSVVTPDLKSGAVIDIWSPDDQSVEYQLDTWGRLAAMTWRRAMASKDPDEATPWSAESILAALADPSTGLRLKDQLRYEPSGEALVTALQRGTTERVRRVLCDVLGDRHERMAVPALIEQLASDEVRSSAADALAKVKDPAAAGALAGWFAREAVPGTRGMLAAALGAVGHRAAIPDLIRALEDASPSVRGAAAWSLGHLKAREAAEPLQAALDREAPGYARTRLEEAVAALARGEPEG